MPDRDPPLSSLSEARVVPRKRARFSLVWIIPILAAIVGAWVAVTRVLSEGPQITIIFRTAEGMEAGKTKIHYNGVDVGTVTSIRLSDDHKRVIATAQMAPNTEEFLADDTRFWLVTPRISGANVTGLGTIISGAYIGMEIGTSKGRKREFVALETPPEVTADVRGRFFLLKTPDLGSIDTGTPIYFRRLKVGEVASYELDQGGRALTVKIFVNAPYDQYVNSDTRFWHASGIDMSVSASGLTVQTQSVLSILVGGIAFETAATSPVLPPADPNTVFRLFDNRVEAFKLPATNPQTYLLVFKDSVRGLAPGAPVEFRGIPIGEVTQVRAQVDLKTFEFSVPVTVQVDPVRLGVKLVGGAGVDPEATRKRLIDALVSRGVRAQLRTGSLLTGSLFVALDFFPGEPPATVDWSQKPARLPTIPGQLEGLETSVVNIIKKLDKVPFQAIGEELRKAIAELDQTLVSARGTLDSATNIIQPNSVQAQKLDSTLQEVSRAARSLRVLADYLERHPEALLRGKKGEAK
jgi:paraquat-inducible protein B